MRIFLIDTDTASDDAVAILMALAAPDVKVLALTTVAGNVGVEQATRNALTTAEIAGVEVPVFSGARAPLNRVHLDAHWFHGGDGLGDHNYPAPKKAPESEFAVDALVRLAHENRAPHSSPSGRSPTSRWRWRATKPSPTTSGAA